MSPLKTSYEKARAIGPLHTGGPVSVSEDGSHIFTCVGEQVVLTRVVDGYELLKFSADNETIYSMCLTPSSSHLILFTASLSMHIYDNPLSEKTELTPVRPTRTISKAHEAPVHVCVSDPSSSLLASGSADGVVKVWDIGKGYVTHVFKGHGGVVSALLFRYVHDTTSVLKSEITLHLISASVDCRLRVFDLSPSSLREGASKPITVLEGHMSVPRGLDITQDGRWLISGGRDSVALLWDFTDSFNNETLTKRGGKKTRSTPSLVRTIPILERVEAVGWLDGSHQFFTAGEKGSVKVWDAKTGNALFALGDEHESNAEQQREILVARLLRDKGVIYTVHADQNILFYDIVNKTLIQQLIGYNDEVVSASFLSVSSPDSHIALATNSSLIRVYSTEGNDARLLEGHSGTVLCLDHTVESSILASGSKDKTARLWHFSSTKSAWKCLAVCEGHAESVGAIALSRKSNSKDLRFMFTGSQDRTIKMWDISSVSVAETTDGPQHCKSLTTQKAHDKDINSLDVAPNDLLLASGSQDRTAKIYEIIYDRGGSGSARGEIRLLGTCRSHKRGVWTVKFGKNEKIFATGSGDKSVKLWNLDDFSCIKTFEGHTNSVLQIDFLNQDSQLASSASDGLLKLWNIRTEECIATMDNHEDKVWALAISSDDSKIVTGAADSVVTIWKDCSEEKEAERQADIQRTISREQDLANYLTLKDYQKAISLALSMRQPGRLLSLFKQVISEANTDTDPTVPQFSLKRIESILSSLPPVELAILLRHARDWNTSAKTSAVAQTILNTLFKLRKIEDISTAFGANEVQFSMSTSNKKSGESLSLNELVQTLIPYTERHLARLERLVQDSYILDYVLGEMDGGLLFEDPMDVD